MLLEALVHDPSFVGIPIRRPFYRNPDGFILMQHPSKGQSRVYIPDGFVAIGAEIYTMRQLLIQSAHHRLAHYGINRTFRDLGRDTFWPGQWMEVMSFVQKCDTCQRNKQPTKKPAGIAQMIQIPERPWQSISMDVAGPFVASMGFKYVLVIVDRCSSFTRIVPLKDRFTSRDNFSGLI